MHKFPNLARTAAQSCGGTRCAKSRSPAVLCSQPHARVCFSAASISLFSQTVRKEPAAPRGRTSTRSHLRDVPIAVLGIPTRDGMLGMRMAGWQAGRYAGVLDDKLRSMRIDDSVRYLRLEYASLMERYQVTRESRRRRRGFEEDLLEVEKVIMCRREVLMARIFELETYEDGQKSLARMGVFRSMWDRVRLATKGRSVWNFFL